MSDSSVIETRIAETRLVKMEPGSMLSITIPGFEAPLLVWATRTPKGGTPMVRIASQPDGGVYSAVMTPEDNRQGAVFMTPKPKERPDA